MPRIKEDRVVYRLRGHARGRSENIVRARTLKVIYSAQGPLQPRNLKRCHTSSSRSDGGSASGTVNIAWLPKVLGMRAPAQSGGGQISVLCDVVVRKNRITTVTISLLERPPRCQRNCQHCPGRRMVLRRVTAFRLLLFAASEQEGLGNPTVGTPEILEVAQKLTDLAAFLDAETPPALNQRH
jgi:hypothetical protein